MILPLLAEYFFYASLVILAGIFLARSVDTIAEITGIARILIGGMLLAGATSLPELLVDINAIKIGQPNLAIGDLLGSSLFNLLILALVDSVYKKRHQIFSPNYIHHSLSVILSIILTAIMGLGLLSEIHLAFFEVGLFTWMIVLVYIWGLIMTKSFSLETPQSVHQKRRIEWPKLLWPSLIFIGATILLLFSAPKLIDVADQLAEVSGLGRSFIGATLIALTTSLPELAATITAFRLNSTDLALANIFGSNTFNMILLLPLDLLLPGPILAEVNAKNAITAFAVIICSGIVLMSYSRRSGRRNNFWEPSSQLILISILASLYLLYVTKGH